jgi:natural product biosynthesis luciferase-like monooxygenase protein
MKFSLFFFSDDGSSTEQQKYHLLLESARFADRAGFVAVWTPERHFHPFGGLYPNPSVLGAALGMVTERLQIRAGSVVLPLRNPIHVAEEWSVVDNLSRGRAGVSFASGWHPHDFVLSPDTYEDRREIMFRGIDTIQKLWRGRTLKFTGVKGDEVDVKLFPQPIQPRLPIWITTSGNIDSWIRAGKIGANILTALIDQSIPELESKIKIYRQSLAEHDHDPSAGTVSLMLHTFVGEDLNAVKEKVRKPLCNYLSTQLGLISKKNDLKVDPKVFSANDKEALVAFAFERYFQTSSLLGTPEKCLRQIAKLTAAGVDEIACMIDFGVPDTDTFESLHHLRNLIQRVS